MSRLIGEPGERWSLRRAVDALAESARWAGRPGWIWIAGWFYPSLVLTNEVLSTFLWLFAESADVRVADVRIQLGPSTITSVGSLASLANGLLFFPVVLLASRLVSGLAFVSGPEEWERAAPEAGRPPRLGTAWAAGRGITLAAFGLWLSIQLITLTAVVALLGPVVFTIDLLGLDRFTLPLALVVAPLALFLFCYVTVLQVMNQLALHSLACNRRGVVSALTHAWRLIRHAPWAIVRAGLVDLVLSATMLLALWLAGIGACLTCCLMPVVAFAAHVAIIGFTGVTRAGYWARLYRELGGLTPSDRVPGLGGEAAADR